MIQHTYTHRRANRGTLIVRASVVAVGFAASLGLQLIESEPTGPASWTVNGPSSVMCVDANGSFAFQ
jgi:hypothetical protein